MAAVLICIAVLCHVFGMVSPQLGIDTTHSAFFEVQYPSVVMSAEVGGNVTVQAGPKAGNILLRSSPTGSIYIDGTDMLAIIKMLNSLPPIWSDMSEHGSLGNFLGGQKINIKITAQDPEGHAIVYQRVSGAFPPGIDMDTNTGTITGTIPDIDAVYEFGIRATDNHGKHADQTFTIMTHESNQCRTKPCQNGGTCIDDIDSFSCNCPITSGGKQCQFECVNHAIGVDNAKKIIPDAQMSAHYSFRDYTAWSGRLHGPGWIGEAVASSWLQVDMGAIMRWFAVEVQGSISSSYYTTTYTMTYSEDGDAFKTVNSLGGSTPLIFNGSTLYDQVTKQVLPTPLLARYVRFIPRTAATKPGMRVEVYACPLGSM